MSDTASDSSQKQPRATWNYSGEVWTDGTGRDVVVLPSFVRTHRAGFDFHLTPISSDCSATVAEQIVDDRFTVATDQPRVTATTGRQAMTSNPSPLTNPITGATMDKNTVGGGPTRRTRQPQPGTTSGSDPNLGALTSPTPSRAEPRRVLRRVRPTLDAGLRRGGPRFETSTAGPLS